jgi:hypothetical protein
LQIAAIRHEDGLEMPPKQKLTENQIADFVKWIEAGAVDPRDGAAAKSASAIDIEKGRQFWAFQPPVKPVLPTVKDQSWPLTEIDRFVRAAQEKNGVTVVADADPQTLVRRLYFDSIGLPPTLDEAREFVRDGQTDAQRTLESTVDRLAASRYFGERWGRHWLDVAATLNRAARRRASVIRRRGGTATTSSTRSTPTCRSISSSASKSRAT